MVFCVSCGKKLAGRYCNQCGKDSQSTADAQSQVPVLTTVMIPRPGKQGTGRELMEGIFFYQQTHEGELQQEKTQAAIKKVFEDAGITPFKEGHWKQYMESSFLAKGSLDASHILLLIRCTNYSRKMPSEAVHISLS